MYQDIYKIEGTTNRDQHPCFTDPNTYPFFQEDMESFKKTLIEKAGTPVSYYKFGDGDYQFLKKNPVGSAEPGKRALSVSYEELDHDRFVKGVEKNDLHLVEIYPENRAMFRELYPDLPVWYPAEYVYGLLTNKWLLHRFDGHIALLGGYEKIRVIKELMSHKKYQDYLGIDSFEGYIGIPEKFACDDIGAVIESIQIQIKRLPPTVKIIFAGIGHVKSAILHEIRNITGVTILDIGSGINALAGTICLGRPYAGNWTNYRLKGYNYSSVDSMDYHFTERQQEIYI